MTQIINDCKGSDAYFFTEDNQDIQVNGDSGANTFVIDGESSDVEINNLGSDDYVTLYGDYDVIESDPNDGQVVLYNQDDGSTVTLSTDDGRDDEFVMNLLTIESGESGDSGSTDSTSSDSTDSTGSDSTDSADSTDGPSGVPQDTSNMELQDLLLYLYIVMSEYFRDQIANKVNEMEEVMTTEGSEGEIAIMGEELSLYLADWEQIQKALLDAQNNLQKIEQEATKG